MTNIITTACSYAERGWPVFPCDLAKHPITSSGFLDATLDTEVIRDWWVQSPAATIGVATGNGLVVIDVDSYKPGGTPQWDAQVAEHGLPSTYTVRTGQGGRQFYFVTDEKIRSNQNVLSQNVDVRSEGGYVIAAGSETMYGPYVVVDDSPLAVLPGWIAEILDEHEAKRSKATPSTDSNFDPDSLTSEERVRLARYVGNAFDRELARLDACKRGAVQWGREVYDGPPWNQTTFEVACNLLELVNSPWNDSTEVDAWSALSERAPRDNGFGDKEILGCFNSARKTTAGKGRALPPAPTGTGYRFEFDDGDSGDVDHSSFFDRGTGLNVTRLVQGVLSLGPLAIDSTENRSLWVYSNGVWKHGPNELTDRVAALLGPRYRPSHVKSVEGSLKAYLAKQGNVITCEPVPRFINVRNGMLDWRSGELFDHDPGYYSTVQLPVEWVPDAECPNFDLFAKEVMADDAIDYLWEILGYLVYSGNDLHRAVLFHGDGGNGKGTLLRVITALLGKHNTSSVTLADITEGKFEVAELYGKIANLAGDIDATYLKSTAKFKAITGQDKLAAQRKYAQPFQFTCWAVPVFSANKLWRSSDNSSGYHRRWTLLSFPHTFTAAADPTLSDRLIQDLPGILVRAVQGLQALMARGDFALPASARDEKDAFELASDQVREWLEDDPAIQSADPSNTVASVSAADAYNAYRAWAQDNGTGMVAAREFRQRLANIGYTLKKSGTMRIYGLMIDRTLRHIQAPMA